MWSLILLGCIGRSERPPAQEPRTHVLFVMIDALRKDAITAEHTPVMAGLSTPRNSSPVAWSSGSWAVPTTISALSGMPIRQHGWDHEPGPIKDLPRIPPVDTLASALADKGYHTSALVTHQAIDPRLGFDRGFDSFKRIVDGQATAAARQEFEGWNDGRKHLLYLHLTGPRAPLAPSKSASDAQGLEPSWGALTPAGFPLSAARRDTPPGARERYPLAYAAVVSDTDRRIGELLTALGEHRGNTLILLTASHGETLGEHGQFGHGPYLWDELIEIPLLIEGGIEMPELATSAMIPALITESLDLEVRWPTPHDAPVLASQRAGVLALSVDGSHRPRPDSPDFEKIRSAWESSMSEVEPSEP